MGKPHDGPMTHTRKPIIRILTATGLGLVLLIAGCGSSANKNAASTSTDDPDSEYCHVIREWSVHNFAGDGDAVADDPVALKKWVGEYVSFLEDGLRLAPDSIHDDWVTYSEVPRVKLPAIMKKYGYDIKRMEAEGTDAEKRVDRAERGAGRRPGRRPRVREPGLRNRAASRGRRVVRGRRDEPGVLRCRASDRRFVRRRGCRRGVHPGGLPGLDEERRLALLDPIEANAPAEIKDDVLADAEWIRDQ